VIGFEDVFVGLRIYFKGPPPPAVGFFRTAPY
jgi:hypothetical protein